MVKTHSFNHIKYEIDLTPCYGDCGRPDNRGLPVLSVGVDKQDSLKFLEILIHESLHASCWAKSEEIVTQTAKDISRLLWRLGFRLRKN